MHIFFTTSVLFLFGASLYLSSWTSSIICSFLLLLVIWTRLFSNKIIKNNFINLAPIKNSSLHHIEQRVQKSFVKTADLPAPQVYLDKSSKNLQIYCFGDNKAPQLIASEALLTELSTKDLDILLEYAGVLHSQKTFSNRQPFVALLVYLGGAGRYIDSGLSFVLGIKTKNGEPRALVRKPLYFVLSKLNFFSKPSKNKAAHALLKNYSYLSFEHQNPVLSPLSVADKTL